MRKIVFFEKKDFGLVILMLLNGLSSLINWLSTIIFARFVSVEEYGQISVLISFLCNSLIIVMPVQTMICTFVASKRRKRAKDAVLLGLMLVLIEGIIAQCH